MKKNILFIEDDLTMQTLVKLSLSAYSMDFAATVADAHMHLEKESKRYAAILVDINLPDGNGLKLLEELVSDIRLKDTPFMIITSDSTTINKVAAFENGADDYILKPFDPLELQARVNSRVKKSRRSEGSFMVSDIYVNTDELKAFMVKDGRHVGLDLTNIEYKLLLIFIQNFEKVFTRDALLEKIWGDYSVLHRTVDSHIAKLRKKLKGSALKIKTLKAVGYSSTLVS